MARAAGAPPEEGAEASPEPRGAEGQGLDPVMGLAATAGRQGRGATKPDLPESASARAKQGSRPVFSLRDQRAQPAARTEQPPRRSADQTTEAGSDGGGGRDEPGAAGEPATRELDAGTRGSGDAGTPGQGEAGAGSGRESVPEEAVHLASSRGGEPAPVTGAAVAATGPMEMAGQSASSSAAPAGDEGGATAPGSSRGPDRAAGPGPKAPAGDHAAQAAALVEEAPEAERYRGLPALRLDLEPEEFGRVRLHVALADQRVFATVVTEREGLRDYLEAQRDRLDAELGKQGLEVGSFLVSTNRREGGEPEASRPGRLDRTEGPSPDEQPVEGSPAILRADGLNLFA